MPGVILVRQPKTKPAGRRVFFGVDRDENLGFDKIAGTAAPRSLLEVRCEALVQQPEAVCRELLGFVGLAWDPRCLDFHQPGNSQVMKDRGSMSLFIRASSAAGKTMSSTPSL